MNTTITNSHNTNTRLFQQAEIIFWDTTIPVMTHIRRMKSAVRPPRVGLPHTWASRSDAIRLAQQILVWSLIGMAFGIFLGFLGFPIG
jgi:hypothetical protein